jgi:hypothetical protein
MEALVLVMIGVLGGSLLYHRPLVVRGPNGVTDRQRPSGLRTGVSGVSEEVTIAPLQFVTPTATAVWSDGTWDCFLSQTRSPDAADIDSEKTQTLPAAA